MAAAVTVSGIKKESLGRVKEIVFPIVFSGTYASGGDTLDLTDVAKAYGMSTRVPYDVQIRGKAGFLYQFEAGTTPANCKIHVFTNSAGGVNAALTEHSNATVVAGVTGDTIVAVARFSPRI